LNYFKFFEIEALVPLAKVKGLRLRSLVCYKYDQVMD